MTDRELRADLDELKKLEALATRVNVKNVIHQEIVRLEASLKAIEDKAKAQLAEAQAQLEKPKEVVDTAHIFELVKSYSFDQTDDFVKVYILLEGVKASGAQASATFTKKSFDLKIMGYKGKDYRLSIPLLHEAIDESNSKTITNNNNVTVKLAKAKKGSKWPDLKFKEGAFKADDIDKGKDPSASLMDMMKKMYEEGDDNMKRTIAEAWTKSREGKGADLGL